MSAICSSSKPLRLTLTVARSLYRKNQTRFLIFTDECTYTFHAILIFRYSLLYSINVKRKNIIVRRMDNNSERNHHMRFDGLRFAAAKRLQKDLKEYTTVILPSCEHRPSVYNEVSRIAKEQLRKIESIHKEEAHPPDDDFEWFLPQLIPSSIVELEKDRNLLDQLLNHDIPKSSNIRSSLATIRDQIQADINTFVDLKRVKILRMEKELEFDLHILRFIAECVEHRPHVYNRVVVQLQKLQRESQFQETAPSRRQPPRLKSGSTPLLRWKREEYATALNRWMDVLTIDEVVDVVPETKVFLRGMLLDLKEECREEAKELQKLESCFISTESPCQRSRFRTVISL